MMMVFGGTTEGKIVADFFDGNGVAYLYSTKNRTVPPKLHSGEYRFGVLDESGMKRLFSEKGVSLIVDAAHPFAAELHKNLERAAGFLDIPVIRFERNYDVPSDILSGACHYYADSYESAIGIMNNLNPQRALAATGVQTIEVLRPYWMQKKMKMRILPSPLSAATALRKGFPAGNLIMMNPPSTWELERHCLLAYGIDCLLTKENGSSGFLPEKIMAAKSLRIPVIILRRPALALSFIGVNTIDGLAMVLDRYPEVS